MALNMLKVNASNFQEGDPVFYYNPTVIPGQSGKLTSHWKPFYRIIEQLSEVNFRIKHQSSGKTRVVHVENIRAAHPDDSWDMIREDVEPIVPEKEAGEDDVRPRRHQPVRLAKLVHGKNDTYPIVPSDNLDESEPEDNLPLAELARNLKRKGDPPKVNDADLKYSRKILDRPVPKRVLSQEGDMNTRVKRFRSDRALPMQMEIGTNNTLPVPMEIDNIQINSENPVNRILRWVSVIWDSLHLE